MRTRWGRRVISYSESVLSTHGYLYTFGFLYIVTNILIFLRQAFEEASFHTNYRRYVTSISRGSGAVINLNAAIVLLLASRSLLGLLRTTPLNMVLPIDKAMPDMHRLVGIVLLLAALLHSGTQITFYFISNPWSPGFTGFTSLFITGFLLLGAIFTIRLVARPTVLHASYELFYYTHVGGSIVLYGLLTAHGLHRGELNTWKYVIGPILIYACDVAFRSLREKKSHLLLLKHSAACQGPTIVKIRLPRVFHYQAGQYAEIKIPVLSKYQWHPFTIASAPHEMEIVFYIKAVGDWTKSLYELFENRTILNDEDGDDIEIFIRGPYGAPAQHVGQFDRVILIGGGVGATPFCSVVKDSYYWIKNWIPRQLRRGTTRDNRNTFFRSKTKKDIKNGKKNRSNVRQENISRNRTMSARQLAPSGNGILDHSTAPENRSAENQSWHLLTTNVISEGIPSDRSIPAEPTVSIPLQLRDGMDMSRDITSSDNETIGQTTMHTALDYDDVYSQNSNNKLSPFEHTSAPPPISAQQITADIETGDTANAITRIETEQTIATDDINRGRRKTNSRLKKRARNNSLAEDEDREGRLNRREIDDDEGMGTYYGTSSGSHRHSLDYLTALHTVAFSQEVDEVFQKSLDMMVGISFGSVSLMKSIQFKKAQRSIREGRPDRVSSAMSLDIFRNPRIMFLLYMRSVTVNMLILWLLILRFTIAGGAFTVRELRLFVKGVQLYDQTALNAIDLVICVLLVVLFALPSFIEMLELGAAPLHGLEMFVLTPIALFDMSIDILALRGLARDTDAIFTVFHVFLIWPVLTILVMVRLLRVIGERIMQVETLQTSHATTRALDFFWTAPTAEDDLWLVGELSKYNDLKEVRLHRYLTRSNPAENGTGRDQGSLQPPIMIDKNGGDEVAVIMDEGQTQRNIETSGTLRTNHGRPKWDEIFNEVAERSENNSTIGIFFCGPLSMERDVQAASMEAMRNSIVRGLQSGVRAMRGLEEIFGDALTANEYTGDVNKTASTGAEGEPSDASRGCNITIVFKRESFS